MKPTQKKHHIASAAAGAALCLCTITTTSATEVQGQIVELSISKNNGAAVFIKMDKAPVPPLACSLNGYWQYTLPLVSDVDKRMFAMLVTAQATGRPVYIAGLGACNEFGAIESAATVRM